MIIPVLDMNARIVIGKVTFPVIHAFKIEESITEPGNKATIELPRNMAKLKGKDVLDYIKVGDAVTIEAGYNGKYYTEFTGHVRSINAEMPLQIICDDEWYQLKQNSFVKSWTNLHLPALLKLITPGYTIVCPDAELGKFEIDNASSYEVLRKEQQQYGLYSRIIGKKLFVDFSWNWQSGIANNHLYHRQKNVKKSDLVWKRKEDFNLRVKVDYLDEKRHKKHVDVGFKGKGGNVKTITYNGASAKQAENMGKSVLNKFAYNGFTGSITGFGTPRTHAGDTITIENNINPEQNGTFLIDRVIISYGPDGFQRENFVAFKTAS